MHESNTYVLVTYNNIRREFPIEQIRNFDDAKLFGFLDEVYKCGYNNGFTDSTRHL